MSEAFVDFGISGGKSFMAESGNQIDINHLGLFGDRETMFVEAEPYVNRTYKKGHEAPPGHFLSQREDPMLSQVRVAPIEGGFILSMRDGSNSLLVEHRADTEANRRPVSVWGWSGEAVDLGDDAAEWGLDFIGRAVRLVNISTEKPRWVEGIAELGRVAFADGYPITIISTRSLELVNEQLAKASHPVIGNDRSRATLVIDGLKLPDNIDNSETAFPEDFIKEIRCITDGLSAVLKRQKACGRCPIPNTEPATGIRKGAPVTKALGTLGRAGYHADYERYGKERELFWTQNFVIELPEDMEPGQLITINRDTRLEVVYDTATNWSARMPWEANPQS